MLLGYGTAEPSVEFPDFPGANGSDRQSDTNQRPNYRSYKLQVRRDLQNRGLQAVPERGVAVLAPVVVVVYLHAATSFDTGGRYRAG